MNTFLKGMTAGFVAGAAAAMMTSPMMKRQHGGRPMSDKAMRIWNEIVNAITD